MPTYGEKPIEAFSAFFNVICPGLGGIVIGVSNNFSGYIAEYFGIMLNRIDGTDLSCDETKAGFQIHIYLLLDLNQVT